MLTAAITFLGIVCLALLIVDYKKGLLVLIMIIPYLSILPQTGITGLHFVNLLYLLTLVRGLTSGAPFGVDRIGTVLKFFIAWLLISAIITPIMTDMDYFGTGRTPGTLTAFNNWVIVFFFYFIFRDQFKTLDEIKTLTVAVVMGYFLEAGFCLFQAVAKGGTKRLYGHVSDNENEFAAFLVAYLVFPMALVLARKVDWEKIKLDLYIPIKLPRLFFFAVAAIGLLDVVYSGSRGAILAIAVIAIVFSKMKSRLTFVVTLALLVFSVTNYETVLPERVVTRINATFLEEGEYGYEVGGMTLERSAGSRVIFNKISLRAWKDFPIWGVGFYALPSHAWERGYWQAEGLDRPRNAHNGFLQILAEFGLIGFALFLTLNIMIYNRATKVSKASEPNSFELYFSIAIMCMIATFMISNLFGSRFFNAKVIAYYFITSGSLANLYQRAMKPAARKTAIAA